MTGAPARATQALARGIRPMTGRDPEEAHRVSSPLELFFDLTFAVAFGVAGEQAAHLMSEGHWAGALVGFLLAMFAIIWAWVNFTWFASAFDTDDWLFRGLTMVQMVGVLILAVGLTPLFHSIDEGHALANGTMVLGYVVMRVAQVGQWLRASRSGDPAMRQTCLRYAVGIVLVQLAWVAFWATRIEGFPVLVIWLLLVAVEFAVPWLAERGGPGTPWHAHHIAERYGLLAIIALGECLLGTVATLSAAIERGWTLDVALVGLAGTGLAFGLWWLYFLLPAGEALEAHRGRGWAFGYGHMPVFASIAAIGAGLHVAANNLGGGAHLSTTAVVLAVAVPVAVYALTVGLLHDVIIGLDRSHLALKGVVIVVLIVAVVLSAAGASLPVCLLVVMLAPLAAIVIDEVSGTARKDAAAEGRMAATGLHGESSPSLPTPADG